MRPPYLFHLYTAATMLLIPFFALIETRKVRRASFSALRAHEKLGHASLPRRGSGPLIWFHAASVGEGLSVLALIDAMGAKLPRAQFLITSGTATSAELIGKRLPERTCHQFAPLDAPGPVDRFLKHWRPEAAVFVESELWPQMLRRTKATGARMILVNARLSTRSQNAWKKLTKTSAYVLSSFDLILTQNDAMAHAMLEMHAPADRVARGFNLKSLSAPLPQDPATLAQVRTSIKGRPVWVAASTHEKEEEIVLAAHKALLETLPDLLLVLAPRHPNRADEVATILKRQELSFATRSKNEKPADQSVYLADTLGELGSWYALSKIIFLGGSLFPIGGHNPYEVAQAGAMTLSGPHVANFAETYGEMVETGAAEMINDSEELQAAVARAFADTEHLEQACRAARSYGRGKASQLDSVADRLIRGLQLEEYIG